MLREITIETLLKMCEEQVALGNGKKKIVLASDDEGNGGHIMYYGFTDYNDDSLLYSPISESEKNDYILLG